MILVRRRAVIGIAGLAAYEFAGNDPRPPRIQLPADLCMRQPVIIDELDGFAFKFFLK